MQVNQKELRIDDIEYNQIVAELKALLLPMVNIVKTNV